MLVLVPPIIMGKFEYDDKGTAVAICKLTEEEQKALEQHNKDREDVRRERLIEDGEWDDDW